MAVLLASVVQFGLLPMIIWKYQQLVTAISAVILFCLVHNYKAIKGRNRFNTNYTVTVVLQCSRMHAAMVVGFGVVVRVIGLVLLRQLFIQRMTSSIYPAVPDQTLYQL